MGYKKIGECQISTESFETKEKGKTNRVLLNGYWIWWCYKHNQPLAWCEKEKKAEPLTAALEQSKEIFSKKLRYIRKKQIEACNLNFPIESDYWNEIYNQFFELRLEIEQMLDKKNLNEFCLLMAFMPEEKREVAIAKAEK